MFWTDRGDRVDGGVASPEPAPFFAVRGEPGWIMRAAFDGTPVAIVAQDQQSTARLARDATTLYWTNEVWDGQVTSMPHALGHVSPIAVGVHSPHSIVVSDAIYVTTHDGPMRFEK